MVEGYITNIFLPKYIFLMMYRSTAIQIENNWISRKTAKLNSAKISFLFSSLLLCYVHTLRSHFYKVSLKADFHSLKNNASDVMHMRICTNLSGDKRIKRRACKFKSFKLALSAQKKQLITIECFTVMLIMQLSLIHI